MGSPGWPVSALYAVWKGTMRVPLTCVLVVLLSVSDGLSQAASSRITPANSDGVSLKTVVDAENTARLLAVLLDSGRNVINENLLMADPQETGMNLSTSSAGGRPDGDRPVPRTPSLSPELTASLFERQLADTFLSRSGIDLRALSSARISTSTKALLKQLVATSKTVVAQAQSGNSQDPGIPTVHLIPAVFGSRVAVRFEEVAGVRLKQTASVPRNPANAPDEFERAVLREFADPAYQREKVITEVTAKSGVLRLMFPLYATRHCLACHGEPRGEADQMGYPKEGLKLGQNAGAISVVIPIQK